MAPDKHILFVEDDVALRPALTALLDLKGYRVGWAVSGREGLAYLRAGDPPGLILLDLRLPDMDGWQFRHEQRRDPGLAAAGYLRKPAGLDELLDAVRQHC